MRAISGLVAAAALASVPAQPAELSAGEARTGAFIGARLRLAVGSSTPAKPEAELMLAPTRTYRSASGSITTRFGEGIAVELSGARPRLTVGGVPADEAFGFTDRGKVQSREKLGVSQGGWIVIGAVVVVAALAVAASQFTCIGRDKDFCGSD